MSTNLVRRLAEIRNGSSRAGGYGYHRPSQAAEGAFTAAGVRLSHPVGGVGDEAVFSAMLALGRALGIPERSLAVCRTHG